MNIKLVITLILVAVVSIFIVQNAEVVDLRFIFWKISMSRSLMYVFLVLIGIAIGWFIRGHMLHKKESKKIKDDS